MHFECVVAFQPSLSVEETVSMRDDLIRLLASGVEVIGTISLNLWADCLRERERKGKSSRARERKYD